MKINPAEWLCTASLAAAVALPRNLEDACIALELPVKKDMEGNRLMKKISKPRKPTKHDKRKWHCKKKELLRVMEYCKQDVEAQTLLLLRLPPLTPTERKVWELDQKINLSGCKVDRPLIQSIIKMLAVEIKHLDRETVKLTGGALKSTRQREVLKKYLASIGCNLPNMKAKTIDDMAASGLVTGKPLRLLRIRQGVSKTSNAKFHVFEQRSRTDSRIRDILMYWGASPGRWTGKGVQVQNFPRGFTKWYDMPLLRETLREGDLEMVRLLYGDPLQAFSDALRSMIIADEGEEFFVGDFSAIEARVGWKNSMGGRFEEFGSCVTWWIFHGYSCVMFSPTGRRSTLTMTCGPEAMPMLSTMPRAAALQIFWVSCSGSDSFWVYGRSHKH